MKTTDPALTNFAGHYLKYNFICRDSTGQNFVVGCDCVEKLDDTRLMSLIQIANEKARKTAERQRKISKEMKRKADNEVAWLEANPLLADAFDFCRNNEAAWGVARDITRKVGEYGSISDKQVALLVREYDKYINPPAKEAIVEAPAGKLVVTGEVLSFKWVDSFTGFGHGTMKMLVRDDRGFKVFGTCPASLSGAVKGSRVTFTATLQPSSSDPSFAFFSRPTKGVCLDEPTEAPEWNEDNLEPRGKL